MARPGTIPPGTTRNPNGRPKKGFTFAEKMREFLSTKDPVLKKYRIDVYVENVFLAAGKGDATAMKIIANYLDGMPAQNTTVQNPDGTGLFDKATFTIATKDE